MKVFRRKKNYQIIIRKYYLDLLNREPDDYGFKYFLNLFENNKIDEGELIKIFKNSDEYKRIQFTKRFYEKYDMSQNFYGKFWVGQDDKWYSEIFDQTPLIHSSFLNYLKTKKEIKTILEVGCGNGIYPTRHKNNFLDIEYTGIDISESAIELCKEKSDFNFICGDFLRINLEKKFDLVFSHSVVDHVIDINLFFTNIVSLSKKYAYVSAYNGFFPELEKHEMKYFKNDGYYLNRLSIKEIRETLIKNGLFENEFDIKSIQTGNSKIPIGTIIEISKTTK